MALGTTELIMLAVVAMVLLAPVFLLVVILMPPKSPNKGTLIALFLGPLAYIYVGKWGKAIGIFVLGRITAGIGHLIIYPYSWLNIRTDVRRYLEDQESGRLSCARLASLHRMLAIPWLSPATRGKSNARPLR